MSKSNRNNDASQDGIKSSANVLRPLLASGLTLFVVTTWFYFVLITHLAAYLTYFSAEVHWFDPSLTRLAGFGYSALIVAAVLVAGYGGLIGNLEARRRYWYPCYGVWLLFIAGYHTWQVLVGVLAKGVGWHIGLSCFNFCGLAIFPLMFRFLRVRSLRKLDKEAKQYHSYIRTIQEIESFLEPSEGERDAMHAARVKRNAIIRRWDAYLSKFHVRHALWLLVVYLLMMHLGQVWCHGTMRAAHDKFRLRLLWPALQAGDRERPPCVVSVFFTDGEASLVGKRTEKGATVYYKNPKAQIEFILPSKERLIEFWRSERERTLCEFNEKNTRTRAGLVVRGIRFLRSLPTTFPASIEGLEDWGSLKNDLWGKPFSYEVIDRAKGEFTITSAGSDGKLGTQDDIVVKSVDVPTELPKELD